jgi:phosphate:Na+ symporter
MHIVLILFQMAGGLCLFLHGMNVMSEGIQQAAGNRMQRVLNFMVRNRFVAVLTGFMVTAIVQSSSAVSVMVVSFVNAGLLTLTQSIGVIMGTNIGTTLTAWIVSLVGFKMNIAAFALPAIGIGFVMKAVKWKHQNAGEVFLGFGFLFLGLEFMTASLPVVDPASLGFIEKLSGMGFLSILIGVGVGTVVTVIMNSSTATTALIITLAYGGLINFDMAAAMILGANIGTTTDAPMAAIGGKIAAKQAALVHVLFNVIGAVIAVIFFRPFVRLVDVLTPGPMEGAGIAAHLAMFHTAFNVLSTIIFLPFINQFAALVRLMVKEKAGAPAEVPKTYKLEYQSAARNTPELNIIRAEKEIRDMAGITFSMYSAFSKVLKALRENPDREGTVNKLVSDLKDKEDYADRMREELTRFLIECTRQQLSKQSEKYVSRLLWIIGDLEDMTDDCYSVSLILERSVRKDHVFKEKEMEALVPYVGMVEDFLAFVEEHLGQSLSSEQTKYAEELENRIDKSRNKLRKLGRKQIEAGEDVKTELLFIDLVRRIEKLGDYCYNIAEALSKRERDRLL